MPKKNRLSHAEFPSSDRSRRVHGALFILAVSAKSAGAVQISCVVSKKVAPKAHDRNLLKRQCREVLRLRLKTLKQPYMIVLQAKKQAFGASFDDIREDIEKLLHPVR